MVHRHHSNNSNPTTVCRGAAIYCASKGAVSNMVRAVATEVAADGVRVNAIAPGIIAVVKANAYGHGARRVASTLEAAGATMLAVADIEEGVDLRKAGIECPILIFGALALGESATLRQIMDRLRKTYCGKIGVEFMHISDPDQKAWIQERIEHIENRTDFTVEGRKMILQRVVEAEGLEHYLGVKFVGTKRFGLDGGESLIPGIEQILKRGGQLGVKEVVLGMPHRGRLNTLVHVLHKSYTALFSEFQGRSSQPEEMRGSGDVKYHLGASADREFDGNVIHLSLSPNPSHLEAVNPVVLGKARAKQDQRNDTDRSQVMAILMHGDAAFAGQGLVAESLDLSDLGGYRIGGTIHFVVNNQIGFTTLPTYSRSGPYCTEIAKIVQAPILHVNGDDPEAVVHVCRIATEFRQHFKCDIVIDMFCYRRYGHNESDEPMFTQPLMYKEIAKHQQNIRRTLKLLGERIKIVRVKSRKTFVRQNLFGVGGDIRRLVHQRDGALAVTRVQAFEEEFHRVDCTHAWSVAGLRPASPRPGSPGAAVSLPVAGERDHREEGRDDREDDRADDRPPDRAEREVRRVAADREGDAEGVREGGDDQQEEAVHEQAEEPEGEEREREGEQLQDRPDEGVHETEDDRHLDDPRKVVVRPEAELGDDAGGDPERDRIDQDPDQEPHGLTSSLRRPGAGRRPGPGAVRGPRAIPRRRSRTTRSLSRGRSS